MTAPEEQQKVEDVIRIIAARMRELDRRIVMLEKETQPYIVENYAHYQDVLNTRRDELLQLKYSLVSANLWKGVNT